MTDVDVLVIGAGFAGAALAQELAQRGLRVLLLERASNAPGIRSGETLPPNSLRAMQRLGITAEQLDREQQPCWAFSAAWGSADITTNSFIRHPVGRGWRIERGPMLRDLRARALQAGAMLRGGRVTDAERMSSGWHVDISGADHICVQAQWVVDASGRARSWARARGAVVAVHDELIAITTTCQRAPAMSSHSGGDTTLVESAPDGWWYSAPLSDQLMTVSLLTDADVIRRQVDGGLNGIDAAAFATLLRSAPHTAARAAFRNGSSDDGDSSVRVRAADTLRVQSARSELLVQPTDERWLAVGDAAAAHDPLCSNGITYALESAHRAAQAIAAAGSGDVSALERYRDSVRTSFSWYLAMRDGYYAQERRWPDSAFWQRRRARAGREKPASTKTSPQDVVMMASR